MNVTGRDEQQLGWTFADFETQLEVGVLSNQNPAFHICPGEQSRIGRSVFLSELLSVNNVVPALLKPAGQSPGQLGINEKSHAASGTIL